MSRLVLVLLLCIATSAEGAAPPPDCPSVLTIRIDLTSCRYERAPDSILPWGELERYGLYLRAPDDFPEEGFLPSLGAPGTGIPTLPVHRGMMLGGGFFRSDFSASRSLRGGGSKPVPARVVVTGTATALKSVTVSQIIDGKVVNATVTLVTVTLQDKKSIIFSLSKVTNVTEAAALFGKRIAVQGKLELANPDITAPDALSVAKDKKLVVVTDKAIAIDENNKKKYPQPGIVEVEGEAVCAKKDLKKLDKPALAIRNGDAPIILEGDKAKVDLAGKGNIRARGVLSVAGGLIRLSVTEIKKLDK